MSDEKKKSAIPIQDLYTNKEYEDDCHKILTAFDGVLNRDEVGLVLAARLRAATEAYIKVPNGSEWRTLIGLVSAYQRSKRSPIT